MSRLAKHRDRPLARDEIARAALSQFDAGADPSMRRLAAALGVAPSAIYHHFPSRAAIVQAVMELVWQEATTQFLQLVSDPVTDDPVDVLVAAGVATRRAFLAHYRVAPFLAATPDRSEFQSELLTLFANLFERLGLEGDAAGEAFHAYSSYAIGAIVFAATRRIANEQLDFTAMQPLRPSGEKRSTREALEAMMSLSVIDPVRDDELFASGLRRYLYGLQHSAGTRRARAQD
jgi:TetR/AcrR family tetracycline transcriptional repressor